MKHFTITLTARSLRSLTLTRLRGSRSERHRWQPGLWARPAAILAIAGVAMLAAVLVAGLADPASGQAPRGAIENLRLSSENPGELTIAWELPDPEPSDYRISWAEESLTFLSYNAANVADRGNEYPTGATTSITLTGLTEGATFKIRMRARYTSGGSGNGPWSGPWSAVVTGTVSETPASTPTLTPTETTEPVIVPDTETETTETDSTIPQITTARTLSVAEGITGLFNFSATDSDTDANDLTWSLTGGADQSHFSLSTSGALAFGQAKDFEVPDDDGADRIYDITVQVSDGANSSSADFTVTLTDVDEASTAPPAPNTPTVFDAGKTGLTVNWETPTHQGSAITGYDLQYRTIDETTWTDGPQDVTETSKTIESLPPDVNYHVRVRAQDATQAGPWSEFGMGTTALWDGYVTVGRYNRDNEQGYWGYDKRPNGNNLGGLTPNSFTYDSTEYEIVLLARHHGERRHGNGVHYSALDFFTHDRAVPDDWVLRFGEKRFFFSEGQTGRVATNRPQFMVFWTNPPDLSLIPHFDKEVSISRDPTRSRHGAGDVTVDAVEETDASSTGGAETAGNVDGSGSGSQEIADMRAEVAHNQVTLRWTAPDRDGISGYRIKRSTESEAMVVHVDDTATADTTYVDDLVGEGTRYTYSVQPILDSIPTDSTASKSVTRSAKSPVVNTMGEESQPMPVLTLLGDPKAKRQDNGLVELPKNSRGEYILPVNREGASYRHSWVSPPYINERSRDYITYSVNLEAHAVYRVSLWDIEYFDHHIQAGPGASVSGITPFIDHDSDYVLADFKHGDAHGSPYEYHIELGSITIGGLEGRGVSYSRSVPLPVSSLRDLSILVADGATQSYVFQPDVSDDHTLRIDALAPGVRYQVRIEKLDDHPDGPSALHRLAFHSSFSTGRGTDFMRYDDYTFGGISPGDQDWFVVSLDANKQYAFSLHGGEGWRNLTSRDFVGLAGPNGIIKPWSTARTTYLSFQPDVAGDHYIGVQSGATNGSGMYVLYGEEFDVPPGTGTNIKLPLGEWYESFYQQSYDQDAFKVDLKANRRYYVALTKGIGGSTDTFQWSRVNHIEAVCQRSSCSAARYTEFLKPIEDRTESETVVPSFLDHYVEIPFNVFGTSTQNDNEEIYSARGVPWTVGWDSDMVEFSPKADGEYIIIVSNVDHRRSPPVTKGGYRLKVVDYGPDVDPPDN